VIEWHSTPLVNPSLMIEYKLYRNAEGTEGVVLNNCTFERLDGNGVMVSGYNRNATVSNSDFAFLGGNAVVAWGYTNETDTDRGRPGVQLTNAPHAGIDGTDGEHPRHTTIISNTAR
jgi:hypothetical protein